MNQMIEFFRIILIFILFSGSFALYFHIAETERKCFIEEVPDDTLVVGMKLHETQ